MQFYIVYCIAISFDSFCFYTVHVCVAATMVKESLQIYKMAVKMECVCTCVLTLWATKVNHTRCEVLKFFDSRPMEPMHRSSFSRINSFFSFHVWQQQSHHQTNCIRTCTLILIDAISNKWYVVQMAQCHANKQKYWPCGDILCSIHARITRIVHCAT